VLFNSSILVLIVINKYLLKAASEFWNGSTSKNCDRVALGERHQQGHWQQG